MLLQVILDQVLVGNEGEKGEWETVHCWQLFCSSYWGWSSGLCAGSGHLLSQFEGYWDNFWSNQMSLTALEIIWKALRTELISAVVILTPYCILYWSGFFLCVVFCFSFFFFLIFCFIRKAPNESLWSHSDNTHYRTISKSFPEPHKVSEELWQFLTVPVNLFLFFFSKPY